MIPMGLPKTRKPASSLVLLTNRSASGTPAVNLYDDGQLRWNGVFYAGEWYIPGVTSGIGSMYQVQVTVVYGSATYTPGFGVWTGLNIARSITLGATSRVQVSIRDVATSTVQATALYTST